MNNAVIYARYSSDNQNPISIDKQIDVCKEFAEKHNLNIIDEYCDYAITGTDDKRPSFQKMIKDSMSGKFNFVIVYDCSRFSRDIGQQAKYQEELKRKNVQLISATETFGEGSSGFINKNIHFLFAAYYPLQLAEKLKAGFREKMNKMSRTHQATFCGGTLAYGYSTILGDDKREKIIVINEEQAEIVNKIYDWFISGLGYKKIIEKLNEDHIKNRLGKPFTLDNVRNILKYEPYTGVFIRNTNTSNEFYDKSRAQIRKYHLKEIRIEDCMPVIITKDKFNAAQQIIKRHSREGKEYRAKQLYLLSGKIYCGKCGRVMIGHNNGYSSYYACPKRVREKQCDTCCIRKDVIESLVIDFLEKVVTEKHIRQMVDFIHKEQSKVISGEEQKLKSLKKSLNSIETKIQRLTVSLENIDGGSSYIAQKIVELEKDEDEIKNKIKTIEESAAAKKEFFTKEEIAKYVNSVVNIKDKTDEQKKKVIDTLIDRIEILSYYDDDPSHKNKPNFEVKINSSLGQLCVKHLSPWDYQKL